MQNVEALHIDLSRVGDGILKREIELREEFFADLNQDEVRSGHVHVGIAVKPSVGGIFSVRIKLAGFLVVACDRCLDDLELPIEAEELIRIKDGHEEESDAVDLRYLEGSSPVYDLAWDVFEIAITSSFQRYHSHGECDEDMVSRISGVIDGENEESGYNGFDEYKS